MSIITIKNDELTVKIKSLGAEITSVTDNSGKEYIWEGNPEFWDGQAPILFPIVSGLLDGKYTYMGKTYEMGMHGFAQNLEFTVEEQSESSATFLLTSNEETLKVYPFEFEFRVKFILDGRKLIGELITDNKTDGEMLYNVGSHEAYKIDGSIEDYSIVLDENETLSRYEVLPVGGISEKAIPCFENSRELKLNDDYFTVDALIFFDMKSRGLALRNDRDGSQIHVDFPKCDTILIWRRPKAPFVCIEPWAGAPIVPWKKTYELTEKFRIRTLKKGESETISHTIEF